MKKKDRNNNNWFSSFMRYRRGKLTNAERHAFEREYLKDPFAGEAAEGLEMQDPSRLEADMRILEARLKRRSSGRILNLALRIAASVVIIAAIGTLVLVLETRKETPTIAANKAPSEAVVEKPSTPVPDKEISPPEAKKPGTGKENADIKIEVRPGEKYAAAVKSDNTQAEAEAAGEDAMVLRRFDSLAPVKSLPAPERDKTRQLAAPMQVMSEEQRSRGFVTGRIISSEDKLPVPGATVNIRGTTIGTVTDINGNFSLPSESIAGRELVAGFIGMETREFRAKEGEINEISLEPDLKALQEVVVIGYGTQKKAETTGAATRIDMAEKTAYVKYIPPEPDGGREAFNRYIEESIKKPAGFVIGERKVVVLSCTVGSNGNIDTIMVVRSDGEHYSSEAIRLVREGPRWKPATENGINIKDEVRLRIVFK